VLDGFQTFIEYDKSLYQHLSLVCFWLNLVESVSISRELQFKVITTQDQGIAAHFHEPCRSNSAHVEVYGLRRRLEVHDHQDALGSVSSGSQKGVVL
jgi:hypothetical protein